MLLKKRKNEMTDARGYVCKCIDGKFGFIAINNTDMKDAEVGSRVVETWTFADLRNVQLRECLYSKMRVKRFIDEYSGSMTYGPDLFCVVVDGKVEINLWQPMHLPRAVELVAYKDDVPESTFLLEVVPVDPEWPILLRKHMIHIIKAKYKQDMCVPADSDLVLYL